MDELIFYIDRDAEMWDYDFRDYVCEENFDDRFVILGGRDFKSYENAEWWKKAKELLNNIDYDSHPGKCFQYYPSITREQRKAILKIYNSCRYSDDTETILDVVNILYPDRQFDIGCIKGYCQGDYAEVIYDKRNENVIVDIECWFFGKMSEIHDSIDNCYTPITDEELWEHERKGDIKKWILDLYGYSEDTPCTIMESDGYRQVKQWKAV